MSTHRGPTIVGRAISAILLAVLPGAVAVTTVAAPGPDSAPAARGTSAVTAPQQAPQIRNTAFRAPAAASSTPCAATAKACVNLSTRQAWLTDGAGHVTYGPVAAHGGSSHAPTPAGTFGVIYKDQHHYSKEFDAPMPYSVFFYPGDALHADNPSSASNGCIHLALSSAQRFFNGLAPGDQVQVIG